MSKNAPSAYGTDVLCVADADALFSSGTGIAIVRQDALHRITSDNVLGPGGEGWGKDCRRLLGMPTAKLPAQQAVFAEVLTRDLRVTSAVVVLTATRTRGLDDVRLAARCETAEGPFDLVLSVRDLTAGTIEGQATT